MNSLIVAAAISVLFSSNNFQIKDAGVEDAGDAGPDKDGGDESSSVDSSVSNCPSDMVEVEGDYCTDLGVTCKFNVDELGHRLPTNDLLWSCGEYNHTYCAGPVQHLHYCIDRYEWPNHLGEKPQDWMSWHQAERAAASVGKRLCHAKEWALAAEGPNWHPLPYGDGFHRDRTKCNFDRHHDEVTGTEAFKALGLSYINVDDAKHPNDLMSQALRLFLVPSGSMPNCVSDYGVHDMAGNIDEWVINDSSQDLCENKSSGNCRSGLMGGHVWHVRNNSFSMTTAHGANFAWYETGFRSCMDIK